MADQTEEDQVAALGVALAAHTPEEVAAQEAEDEARLQARTSCPDVVAEYLK